MNPQRHHYRDDGALRDQDRVPLSWFAQPHERAGDLRGAEPFFSGREENVNAILRAADDTAQRGNGVDATCLVTGPPGAGKTALLAQVRHELLNAPADDNGWVWACPVVGADVMDDLSMIGEAINQAVDARMGAGAASWTQRTVEQLGERAEKLAQRGIQAAGTGVGADPGAANPRPHMRRLAAQHARRWQGCKICLFIDEGQKMVEAAANPIFAINTGGVQHPILCVVGGLPSTVGVLARLGVSRFIGERKISLTDLPDEDALKMMRRAFEVLGIPATDREDWANRISEGAGRFALHVRHHINALGEAALERGPDFGTVDQDEVLDRARHRRKSYYAQIVERLVRADDRYPSWAGALAAELALAGGLTSQRIRALLRLFAGERGDSPTDQQLKVFIAEALECGVIQPAPDQSSYFAGASSCAGDLRDFHLAEMRGSEPK